MLPSAGLIFSIVALAVSAAIIYYFPRVPENQAAVRVALALQLGGAVGNLIDRVLLGTVTDFISLGAFPVFNVADASIRWCSLAPGGDVGAGPRTQGRR
jgi:signal peptidase II